MKNARTTMKEIDPAAARAVAWPVQAAPVSCFTSAAGSVELATNPNPTRRPGEIAGREGWPLKSLVQRPASGFRAGDGLACGACAVNRLHNRTRRDDELTPRLRRHLRLDRQPIEGLLKLAERDDCRGCGSGADDVAHAEQDVFHVGYDDERGAVVHHLRFALRDFRAALFFARRFERLCCAIFPSGGRSAGARDRAPRM